MFFTQLGAPTLWQLMTSSVLWQRRWQLQRRFMKFLWRGEYLKLDDGVVSTAGSAAVICDVVVLVGIFGVILNVAMK